MTCASRWLDGNKLLLNVAKTKCMYIATSVKVSKASFPELKCKEQVIGEVDSFKYLGAVLDNSLKFDKHTSYIRRKVFIKMKTLGRIRSFISEKLALQLYKSLIVPHLDYVNVIYDAANKRDFQTLQVIQNGCLRICFKADPRTPVAELHSRANLPTLPVRRAAHSCNIVFNGLNGTSTYGINNMFTYVHETHDINTRASSTSQVKLPKYRLAKSHGNLRHRGGKYFNDLPQDIKDSTSSAIFKKRIKSHSILQPTQ